jgi:hypothetical protein
MGIFYSKNINTDCSNNSILKYKIKKKCVLCNYTGNSDDALLEMYSKYNVYNNQFVCINCFMDVINTDQNNLTYFDNNSNVKNKFTKVRCEWCNISSANREIFKIFWKGKFNNHFMCYLCLHSKEHRRNRDTRMDTSTSN